MGNTEDTLVIIKPDAVAAGRTQAIMEMISETGLYSNSWLITETLQLKIIEEHYAEHRGKPFYADLCAFMTSGPSTRVVISGWQAVRRMRSLAGATDPKDWKPGTIRHKYGTSLSRNAIHSSDSLTSAERELALFRFVREVLI